MQDNDDTFLSRWSRRKQHSNLQLEAASEPEPPTAEPTDTAESVTAPEPLPLWQQPDADPLAKRQALRDLFRRPQFNKTDGLDEYDNDYNYHQFAKLGSLVTHEMKRMLQLAEDKAQTDTSQNSSQQTAATAPETDPERDQQEDKPVA